VTLNRLGRRRLTLGVGIAVLASVAAKAVDGRPAHIPSASTVQRRSSAVPPPELPDEFEDISDAVLRDYLAGLTWANGVGDTSGDRGCEDKPEEHSKDCLLEITPVIGAEGVSADEPGEIGRVVAKIYNRGPKNEGNLHVPKYETAYWLVRERPFLIFWTRRQSLFFTFEGGKKQELRQARRSFKSCNETHPRPCAKHASFKECNKQCPEAVRTKEEILQSHTTPPWVYCLDGCCQAS
jgi:hypothetical protein